MDLAKVGETKHLFLVLREMEAVDRIVNEELTAGWVILSTKIVELREAWKMGDGKYYPQTRMAICYVLGKPRSRYTPRPFDTEGRNEPPSR